MLRCCWLLLLGGLLWGGEKRELRPGRREAVVVEAGELVAVPLSGESRASLAGRGEVRPVEVEGRWRWGIGLNLERGELVVGTSRLLEPGRRRLPYAFVDEAGVEYAGAVEVDVVAARPLPKTNRVPVVFLNGYQPLVCSLTEVSATFGQMATLLGNQGVSTVFFDNCVVSGSPSIEQLGVELAELIGSIRYIDGTAPPVVDVVAHSMGGLIVRSYLAGKQPGTGRGFRPPVATRIRKFVSIATPNFGADFTLPIGQSTAMKLGSRMLYDLATWNQGVDDLRSVDFVALAGNAARDVRTGLAGASDGLVGTLSASGGGFAGVEAARTRVLPYCHTSSLVGITCPGQTPTMAFVTDTSHLSWQIVDRFLRDDATWRLLGTPEDSDAVLSRYGGMYLTFANANGDLYTGLSPYWYSVPNASNVFFGYGDAGIGQRDLLPVGSGTVTGQFPNGAFGVGARVVAGGYTVQRVKFGPQLGLMVPATNHVSGLSVAPRMLVTIYGSGMTDAGQFFAGTGGLPTTLGGTTVRYQGVALGLVYASPAQINAVLPESLGNYGTLSLSRADGAHTLGVLVEDAKPSLFTVNGQGTGALAAQKVDYTLITAQNPVSGGDYVVLYGTGLGVLKPTVTALVGGQAAAVVYAGPAPGFPGLDQINVQLPANVPTGDAVSVQVFAGGRASNVGTIAVR